MDAVLAETRGAGAQIVKPAVDAFWGGYSGYFRDLDGHLWEVGGTRVFRWRTPAPSGFPIDGAGLRPCRGSALHQRVRRLSY